MFQTSLTLAAILTVLAALIMIARWFLARRALQGEAAEEYTDRIARKPDTVRNVAEAEFITLYTDSHAPRWALYAAGGLMAALAASPVALLAVPALYDAIWRMNGAPDWAGRGGYVFMFSLFFGIVLIWALAAGVFARLHHKRTPEPFQFALARARGEPIPEEASWRRRPKWARRARPMSDEEREARDADIAGGEEERA
ncbi:MAG: hypothetical protein AAFX09_06195 [Pseudomonadota bacterium]